MKKRIIKALLVLLFLAVLHLGAYAFFIGLPFWDFTESTAPATYITEVNGAIPAQTGYQCAAYASAFTMRYFNQIIDPIESYETFKGKMSDGTILPRGVVSYFKDQGLDVHYYKGSFEQLKTHISDGIPVIVFIKVDVSQPYLHYVPVVGYDETYVYLAESLPNRINVWDKPYNRRVPIETFMTLWDIGSLKMPYHSFTYFVVSSK